MSITQTIPAFTGTLPDKNSQTPEQFDTNAQAWVNYQGSLAPAMNTYAGQANSVRNTVNAASNSAQAADLSARSARDVALASANYKGNWSATSYAVPSSVTHLGALWVLNTAAVAGDVPGTSTKWTFWSLDKYLIPVNPSLDLDFGNQTYRSYVDHLGLTSWPLVGTGSKITFARAGTGGGTYFDARGVMQQAGENEPRIDFDPVTGECLGLLVEEQRSNNAKYSEDFSNAAWLKSNATITSNAANAPDGNATADTFTSTANDATVLQAITTTAVNWTFSIYLKRKTGSGVVSITMNGTEWEDVLISSENWTRLHVVQTGVAGTSNCGIRISTSGDEVYLWGAQAE